MGEKVTACLLTYNHAHVVAEAIRTALDQTVGTHELVVSDDRSTDGTWERVQALASMDARIRPIQTPRNLGMAGNANFAAAHARRPYLAILHHDDRYRSDLLERWAGVLERHPDVGFVFNNYADAETGAVDRHLDAERVDGRAFLDGHLLARWGCPVRGTAMIRRSCWEAVGGMDEGFGSIADVDLWMRLAARWAVGYVDEPLITVRHERPLNYPAEYRADYPWERARRLYEIHAANIAAVYPRSTLRRTAFHARVSLDVAKWLAYAVVRRRAEMLRAAPEGANAYEWRPVAWARRMAPHLASWALPRPSVADP